jgi:hypothetical protein
VTASSVLVRGRAAAERLMVDTCLIRRSAGKVTDPETGQQVVTWIDVYEGKCQVQQVDKEDRAQDLAAAHVVVLRRTVKLPVAASAGVREGDQTRILTCVHDPDMADRVFMVKAEHAKTYATARRVSVEEVTS